MERYIKIFKSFEEQEQHHLLQMALSTPIQRFRRLYMMQQMTKSFHPEKSSVRKIIIRNGRT